MMGKVHAVLSFGARILLAVVFIWASVHKVLHPDEFALTVATYQMLPLFLINLQAIGLPWVELIVGVTLIIGVWTRESALVTIGMNVMFIVAIFVTLSRGDEIMCGCFASAEAGHQIDWTLAARDFGLLLVGAYLAVVGAKWPSLDAWLARRKEEASEED